MTTTEPTGGPAAAPARRPGPFVPVALVVVTLALLVTSALLWWSRDDAEPSPTAGTPGKAELAMVVAARQAALDFYNLDHRHARADVDRVIASATGDFRRVYAAKSDALVREVVAKKLATTATIVGDGVAVEYAHGEFGQVLVALDLVKSQGDRTGEPTPERARVSVRKVGDRWLVANVQGVR